MFNLNPTNMHQYLVSFSSGNIAEARCFDSITDVREAYLDFASRVGFEPMAKGNPLRSREAFRDFREDFAYFVRTETNDRVRIRGSRILNDEPPPHFM